MRTKILISFALFAAAAFACRSRIAVVDRTLNPFPSTYEVAWKEAWRDQRSTHVRIMRDILLRRGPESRYARLAGFDLVDGRVTHGTFYEMLVATDTLASASRPDGAPIYIPGILFDKGGNKAVALGLGQLPDPSWKLLDIDTVEPRIAGWMFHYGYNPLSLGRLAHDFYHTLTLTSHLDFAEEIFNLRQFYESGGSKLTNKFQSLRFAYFYEAFTSIPEALREKVIETLGAPFNRADVKDLTLEKLVESEKDVPIAVIRRSGEQLLKDYHPYCIFYGAAGREMAPFYSRMDYAEHFVYESVPAIARRLTYAALGEELHGVVPDLRVEYARFRLAIYYSIGITPALYAKAARSDVALEKSDPIYKLFVHSGISEGIRPGGEDPLMRRMFNSPELKP